MDSVPAIVPLVVVSTGLASNPGTWGLAVEPAFGALVPDTDEAETKDTAPQSCLPVAAFLPIPVVWTAMDGTMDVVPEPASGLEERVVPICSFEFLPAMDSSASAAGHPVGTADPVVPAEAGPFVLPPKGLPHEAVPQDLAQAPPRSGNAAANDRSREVDWPRPVPPTTAVLPEAVSQPPPHPTRPVGAGASLAPHVADHVPTRQGTKPMASSPDTKPERALHGPWSTGSDDRSVPEIATRPETEFPEATSVAAARRTDTPTIRPSLDFRYTPRPVGRDLPPEPGKCSAPVLRDAEPVTAQLPINRLPTLTAAPSLELIAAPATIWERAFSGFHAAEATVEPTAVIPGADPPSQPTAATSPALDRDAAAPEEGGVIDPPQGAIPPKANPPDAVEREPVVFRSGPAPAPHSPRPVLGVTDDTVAGAVNELPLSGGPVTAPGPHLGGAPTSVHSGRQTLIPEIAGQLHAALTCSADGTTDLALAPEELGHVRLRLKPDAKDPDRMVVTITFDRPETLELFRRHSGELAEALRAAGYSGADIGFGQGPDRNPASEGGGRSDDAAPETGSTMIDAAHEESQPVGGTGSSLDLRL